MQDGGVNALFSLLGSVRLLLLDLRLQGGCVEFRVGCRMQGGMMEVAPALAFREALHLGIIYSLFSDILVLVSCYDPVPW